MNPEFQPELPRLSQQVWDNLRAPRIAAALLPPRSGQPPRAIPERIGELSLIKHVVYIIKENRTYDQVLGDIPAGNGSAQLCTFGEQITPLRTSQSSANFWRMTAAFTFISTRRKGTT